VSTSKKQITVFEHQTIKLNQFFDSDVVFNSSNLEAFQKYYGEKGCPYFSLIHNGIKFNEHVGAIQVGNLLVEVLPKADKNPQTEDQENKWRDILIGMVRAVTSFEIKTTSNSNLRLKPNSILDLYFELFVNEVEYLLHTGLVKKYRKHEGNTTSLKGSLQFGKHIQQNLTHQERFYVRFTTYDTEHQLHVILYKTLRLLKHINTNVGLQSRIGSLLLYFPEMPDIKVIEATFNKLVFDRKTERYRKAIDIAKLLLLQYHPDVSKGRNDVLALMFDMNLLWEQFVYVSLRKHIWPNTTISKQVSKHFWQPNEGYRSTIRPDIVIKKNGTATIVLDTKWKNLDGYNPSLDDLRQMYVYHEYFSAERVALVYPGGNLVNSAESNFFVKGSFLDIEKSMSTKKECSLLPIGVHSNIKEFQNSILDKLDNWLK
jgi:5-methylcytosine-specific restriction enzyme subunit McrC